MNMSHLENVWKKIHTHIFIPEKSGKYDVEECILMMSLYLLHYSSHVIFSTLGWAFPTSPKASLLSWYIKLKAVIVFTIYTCVLGTALPGFRGCNPPWLRLSQSWNHKPLRRQSLSPWQVCHLCPLHPAWPWTWPVSQWRVRILKGGST